MSNNTNYLESALREAAASALFYNRTLQQIADLLSGIEWGVDTLDAIACAVRAAGFEVRDTGE